LNFCPLYKDCDFHLRRNTANRQQIPHR